MEYKVTITLTEIYSGYVEANSEEEAEKLAHKALDNQELSLDVDSMDVSVELEE